MEPLFADKFIALHRETLRKRPFPTKILGYGSFGCVYRTEEPRVVFKLTGDHAEVRLIEKILQCDPPFDGFVRYYEIIPIDGLWGIWREEVDHMGIFQRSQSVDKIFDRLEFSGSMLDALFYGHHDDQEFYTAMYRNLPFAAERVKKEDDFDSINIYEFNPDAATKTAVVLQMYSMSALSLLDFDETRDMGESILRALDDGIILTDVRVTNIAVVERNYSRIFVIADPSLPVFMMPM